MRDAIKALADEYERKAQKLESAWAKDPDVRAELVAQAHVYEQVARDLRNLKPLCVSVSVEMTPVPDVVKRTFGADA